MVSTATTESGCVCSKSILDHSLFLLLSVVLVVVLSLLEVVPAQDNQCSSGFTSIPTSCRASSDCRHVSCSSLSLTGGTINLTLTVDNCKDPVKATLTVAGAVGECLGWFYVNGNSQVWRTLSLAGGLQLNATFYRSATLLHFEVSECRVTSLFGQ